MYFVYIIESAKSGMWYYGKSQNPERRLDEHNSGQTTSTKGKGPWQLIFLKSFDDNSSALAFEKKLKQLRNKEYIKREYFNYFL